MSSNFLSLNPSKTEFLIFGLPQQLYSNSLNSIILPFIYSNNDILSPVDSDRNPGVIFDKICHLHNISLLFLNHASTIFVIRLYGCNTIDQTACLYHCYTSLIHSKIDYSNSLLLNLPATQTNLLQLVLNSAARAVTKTLNFITLYSYSKISPLSQDK